ncbi:SlyX family protein [Halopseudomonas sabulinigri]|uniref:Protein SlyX homolog n=1 Tax=Halopseudomonas sabulinigri TaxID=472181 RepID=A0ABP9ZQU0_9GAMM
MTVQEIDTLLARLNELETRLAFQDDIIQSLNDALGQQQIALDRLQRSLQLVAKRQSDMASLMPGDSAEDQPPPHY